DGNQSTIEQRVQIGSQEEAVRDPVRLRASVWVNVSRFEYVEDVAPRNRALPAIRIDQSASESALAAPLSDRSINPFPCIGNICRIEGIFVSGISGECYRIQCPT